MHQFLRTVLHWNMLRSYFTNEAHCMASRRATIDTQQVCWKMQHTWCVACVSLIADFTCTSSLFSCTAFVPLIVMRLHVYDVDITAMKPCTLIGRMQMQNKAALFCLPPCTDVIHKCGEILTLITAAAWATKLLTCRIPQAYYRGLPLTRERFYCTIHFMRVFLYVGVIIIVACILCSLQTNETCCYTESPAARWGSDVIPVIVKCIFVMNQTHAAVISGQRHTDPLTQSNSSRVSSVIHSSSTWLMILHTQGWDGWRYLSGFCLWWKWFWTIKYIKLCLIQSVSLTCTGLYISLKH